MPDQNKEPNPRRNMLMEISLDPNSSSLERLLASLALDLNRLVELRQAELNLLLKKSDLERRKAEDDIRRRLGFL